MIDDDPFVAKHAGNHSISDPPVIGSQIDDLCTDLVFIAAFDRLIPVGVAVDS